MPPKKDAKKQVEPQPPKQQQPQIPEHQLQGYGKFEYLNGSIYQGNWRLFSNIKCKHGQGILKMAPNSNISIIECYQGAWVEDKMQGCGSYQYADGSIFRGQWKDNKQHGRGEYEFANGTIFQGQWQNHKMHGSGFYIDHLGRKWEGQWREGKFESRRQKELLKERAIKDRKIQMKKEIEQTIQAMLDAITKSDKKTLKDNFGPFFPLGDSLKEFLKEPYSKYDEKPSEKWTQILTACKYGSYCILNDASEGSLIASDRILVKQLEGAGQIVEVSAQKDDKCLKIAFANAEKGKWLIVGAEQK